MIQQVKKNASHSSLGKDGSVFPVLRSSTPERSSKERVRDIQVEERPTQKQREMLRGGLLWDHIEMYRWHPMFLPNSLGLNNLYPERQVMPPG